MATESVTVKGVGRNYNEAKTDAAQEARSVLDITDGVYLNESDMPQAEAWRLDTCMARRSATPDRKIVVDCTFVFRYPER